MYGNGGFFILPPGSGEAERKATKKCTFSLGRN